MASTELQQCRVVPTGQVYRQIFEAEVQLVDNLEKSAGRFRKAPLTSGEAHDDQGLPVVREGRAVTGHGILTTRQHHWVKSSSNDPYTENPVYYKKATEFYAGLDRCGDESADVLDVLNLPDDPSNGPSGSDIIGRIAEGRTLRHQAAVEDMYQELEQLSDDLAPFIEQICHELLTKLSHNDSEITQCVSPLTNDEDLKVLMMNELAEIWEQVASHTDTRQHLMRTAHTGLEHTEVERGQLVRDVFSKFSKILKRIAHILPDDVDHLLDKESQIVNQCILSNRRHYTELVSRLMKSDISRERRLRQLWEDQVHQWKALNIQVTIDNFSEFMNSDEIKCPPLIDKVLSDMKHEQCSLNTQRIALIEMLSEFTPPAATKAAVYQWNNSLANVTKQLLAIHEQHLNTLHREYETVCQSCLSKVDDVRVELVQSGVATETEARAIIEKQFLPLVGEQQRIFETELENMDSDLEKQSNLQQKQLQSLFRYAQGLAHVWDVHEIGLANQERALQENLQICRHKHDTLNHDRETNLDMLMDRMRQDATETALRNSLRHVLEILERIKNGYVEFHKQQQHIVKKYPDMVNDELNLYDEAICKFFTVSRQHPYQVLEVSGSEGNLPTQPKDVRKRSQGEETVEPSASVELINPETEDTSGPKIPDGQDEEQTVVDDNEEDDLTPTEDTAPVGDESHPTDAVVAAGPSSEPESSPPQGPPVDAPTSDTIAPLTLPMIVDEVLSTSTGVTFYVLTEAGEHGVPPGSDGSESETHAESCFLTDLYGRPAEGGDMETPVVPEYLDSFTLSYGLLLKMKKMMRLSFLNQLVGWRSEALARANSVVSAKLDELFSEYELRLHLHAPRSKRAELDVHNVRAAELVMHSERVSRHIKGVSQTLSEVRQKFNNMTTDHNKMHDQFKSDIEALETVFTNATKSTSILSLSNQLEVEKQKFMDIIRSSLRHLRQGLDDTNQMLRESNAQFIKSFRVFSDGGNFCPDEIDDYKKRLDKMAHKIDQTEGFIMADLESMESARLERATQVCVKFEDRFKHHLVDLVHIEKIQRWITNTQVKIKAEVADSNSQSQHVDYHLQLLSKWVDSVKNPAYDKEELSAADLQQRCHKILRLLHDRSLYLDCLKSLSRPPSLAPLQGNPALAGRVGFASEIQFGQHVRHGRHIADDTSINLLKNIMRTQKDKSFDQSPVSNEGQSDIKKPGTPTKSDGTGEVRGMVDDRPRAVSRRSATTSVDSGSSKRVSSGGGSVRRGSRGLKFDKKYLVFGEKPDDEVHFLANIRRILQYSLEGLLTVSDTYYRQKASRAVTRKHAIQDSFDQCADAVIVKLQSYQNQTEDYHNRCLQEFRRHLQQLERIVSDVPSLVMEEFIAEKNATLKQTWAQIDTELKGKLKKFTDTKNYHKEILRPTMGHPEHTTQLMALCDKENVRQQECRGLLDTYNTKLMAAVKNSAACFIEDLATLSERLLIDYDSLLTIDDCNTGRIPMKKLQTDELIRRQTKGGPLEIPVEVTQQPRGRGAWPGIPVCMETAPGTPEEKLTASINTVKITMAHNSIMESRNNIYKEFRSIYNKSLSSLSEKHADYLLCESRWMENWTKSVNKVKQLYKTD